MEEALLTNGHPKMQRALVADAPNGTLEIREVPIPNPADDEILVRIRYSGICHSDLHGYLGDFSMFTVFPLIGGHEGAGEVVAVGKSVNGWSIGDKAGIKLQVRTCLACEFCKQSHEPSCAFAKNFGFDTPGTFQEYISVRALDAAKIPENVDLAEVAPILCAGVTIYRAIRETNVRAGQILAISGAGGGLGSLGIQYARAMGFKVLAIDHPSKEEHCRKLGADFFQDAFAPDLIGSILKITNGGPHGVVNVAVAKKPMEDAIYYTRKRGTIVFVGLPKECKPELDSFAIVFNCLTIKGTLVGNRKEVDDAIEFLANGSVKVPVEKVRLEDVASIYDKMLKGTIVGRAVVDFSQH